MPDSGMFYTFGVYKFFKKEHEKTNFMVYSVYLSAHRTL